MTSMGGRPSGPPGANVPSVKALLAFSRHHQKKHEIVPHPRDSNPGRSPVACRGSFLGPPGGHRTVGGSVPVRVFDKPPARSQERFHLRYGGPQGAGAVSCGLLGVVPRALWEPPCRRWKRFCPYFCKAAGLMPGTLPPTLQWPSWGALPPVLTQREAQRQPPPPSVAQRGGATAATSPFRCAERGLNGLPGGLP